MRNPLKEKMVPFKMFYSNSYCDVFSFTPCAGTRTWNMRNNYSPKWLQPLP